MTYEVETQIVTLSHDGLAVHCLVFRPAGLEPGSTGLPAVICSHGFRATFVHTEPYARAFAKAGFVAVAFDFCGGGKGSLSAGDPSRMSVVTERQDLACVLDYVRSLPEVDTSRIALLGQSQGGAVSAMLACRQPRDIWALMLLYPAFCIRDDMMRLFGRPDAVPMVFDHMDTRLGRVYAVDAMAWEPMSHLESYDGPVHLWHGDADKLVALRYSEEAQKHFPNATLTVVPGAGHGFEDEDKDRVMSETVEWLKELADTSRAN